MNGRIFMEAMFWFAVSWLFCVYAGYSVMVWIAGLFRGISPNLQDHYYPSVSVLISARNEEKDIAWKVRETLEWNYPAERLEILVASDASEDGTDEIMTGLRSPRVRFVRMETRGGKNVALNHLAGIAKGDLLFFTDANAHIPAACLSRITRHFADERVGCVSGHSIATVDENDHAIGKGAGVYWGFEDRVNRLEDRIGSVLVCDGAVFCARRALFTALAPALANDLELPIRIGSRGYWTRFEPEAVVIEKDTPSVREEYHRRRRISGQGFLAMVSVPETRKGFRGLQFFVRKFLRWMTLIPMAMILAGSVALGQSPFFKMLLAAQAVFYFCALFAWISIRRNRSISSVFSVPFYVLLGSTSALVGIVDVIRGKRYSIWEVPKLSRGRQVAAARRI